MSASVFWHSYLFNVPLFIAILAILPWRIPWRAPHPWLWACYIAVVQSVKLYLQLDSVLHDTTASLIMWGLPQQIFNILMMSFCIGISLPEACLFFSLLFLFVDSPTGIALLLFFAEFRTATSVQQLFPATILVWATYLFCLTIGIFLLIRTYSMLRCWPERPRNAAKWCGCAVYLLFTLSNVVLFLQDGLHTPIFTLLMLSLCAVAIGILPLVLWQQQRIQQNRMERITAHQQKLYHLLQQQAQALEQLRAAQHEAQNHLLAVQGYVQQDQPDAARLYLRQLLEQEGTP